MTESEREFDRGAAMHSLLRELYPLCRSITGNGVRQTLHRLKESMALEIHEVPSGTQAFDWIVPSEWNIHEAWIEDPSGKRIVDFANNNLHVMSYSEPVDGTCDLVTLQRHLHSLPSQPTLIPYKTSYYQENWGFCLSHEQREQLPEGDYRVRIDATKSAGSLTYGEWYLPGESSAEFLISTHICHPSLANDNLSGIVVAEAIANSISKRSNRKLSYRILFVPGTIGAITWLSRNAAAASRVAYGLVLSGVGDSGTITYKRSRRGNARIDRVVEQLGREASFPVDLVDFTPYGYDERQYCSPGFNLPMGTLSRSPYGTYTEYHTSADSPEFVTPESLLGSLEFLESIVAGVENEMLAPDGLYWNTRPDCEVQLGKRGLYGSDGPGDAIAFLWVLNFSDGNHSLREIAERSLIPLNRLVTAAETLLAEGLLRRIP